MFREEGRYSEDARCYEQELCHEVEVRLCQVASWRCVEAHERQDDCTSKTDIAQAFFPNIGARPARHKLMQVITSDPFLVSQLEASGYNPTSHLLSPAQVDMILNRLGNPFK